jgi:hypothetical protein
MWIFGSIGTVNMFPGGHAKLPCHQPHARVSVALQPHQHLALFVFSSCYSDGSIMGFHCGFNLYFPDN